MRLKPKETPTDTSSAEPQPVICMPGTEEYETAFTKIYGKKGPPSDNPFDRWPKLQESYDRMKGKAKDKAVAMKTGSLEEETKMVLFRDHHLSYPELYLGVLVVGPPEDTKGFPEMFSRALCHRATSVDTADLVVFTGGPDVDPMYYGETPHPNTYVDKARDDADVEVYLQALDAGCPMVGVCRGAQAIAAWNGFKLFQDIDKHQEPHYMWSIKDGAMIERISSAHHQSVVSGAGMEIVGVTNRSTVRYKNADQWQRAESENRPFTDIEAFFLRDISAFCVQGHPEYKGFNAYTKWFLDQIYQLISCNPDVAWNDNGRLRIDPKLVTQRCEAERERYNITEKGREIITVKGE